MSSSDEEFSEDYVMYKNREDWKDITPIPQNDGPHPVVKILYSENFNDVYDYFRAIVNRKEYSERALHLTRDALKLNAANYSVWHYRRDILKHLNADLQEELMYAEQVIEDNPKNYQVWHHRRVIVEWLADPSQELNFTAKMLETDAKNYHAWQHRQWIIKTFNLWDDELRYTDFLISQDIRNNSAWNQRYFVLQHTGFTPEILDHEVHFVMNRIRLVKNNESSWNYLRGLLQNTTLEQYPEVFSFVEELFDEGQRSPYLLAFLFDSLEEKCIQHVNEEAFDEYERRARQICELLETKHDTIRCKYWKYMGEKMQFKIRKAKSVEYGKNGTDARESVSM